MTDFVSVFILPGDKVYHSSLNMTVYYRLDKRSGRRWGKMKIQEPVE
jgi:hypothetical protein